MTAARALALVGVALLLCIPSTAGKATDVHEVVFDRIETIAAAEFELTPCQDTGVFIPTDTGFRFEERQPGSSDVAPTPYPQGYLAIGCGEATARRNVPLGAKSVEVRFLGDRVVDEFDVQGSTLTRPGREFTQEIQFRGGNGTGDRRVAYMDPAAASLPLQVVAPDSFLLPRNATEFDLAWVFRDTSYFVAPDLPDVLSGQAFSATVQDVTLRYPDLPISSSASDRLRREGQLLVGETRVNAEVLHPTAGDLRLVVAAGLVFDHVRGPDGQRIATHASRFAAGPDGFDRTAVLVETLDDGAVQVTVPRELLTQMGPGTYVVAFSSVDVIETYPWLMPIAFLVLLAPLPFALLAYMHVRRFEDEAFGGFRRSARNLRIALVVAFAYYVAVLVSHFVGSRFELMTAWPLPFEAVLLYVQVFIAIGAFLALFTVARELYQITAPKPLPASLSGTMTPPFSEDHE